MARPKIKRPEMPWFVGFQHIEAHVVKILTPQGSGTGFLLAWSGNKQLVGVATAAHVVSFAQYWEQPIRMEHFKSGATVFLNNSDRAIEINYEADSAFIMISGDKLPFPEKSLEMIPEDKRLKVGVEVAWMGFPAIAPSNLCFFSGNISAWVEALKYYYVDGVAINGVSGGPTFYVSWETNRVSLIGLVSAYVPNQATGLSLPGLCVVRDMRGFYQVIKNLRNIGEAKEAEKIPEAPPAAAVKPSGGEPGSST